MKCHTSQYNCTALEIWRNADQAVEQLTEYLPLLRPDLPADGTKVRMACLGLNGAFNEGFFTKHFEKVTGTPWARPSPLRYCPGEPGHEKRVQDALVFEQFARNNYNGYFGPLKSFITECGIADTVHLDLFLVRNTDSACIQRALGLPEAKAFLRAQVDLCVDTLSGYGVQLVVVNNAKAASVLMDLLKLQPTDETRRFYRSALLQTDFILSSQLHGGSLDRFSRDRLVADVREAARSLGIETLPRPPYRR